MALFKIHPAIGMARLGDSESDFYLSPEQPGNLPIACDTEGRATIDDGKESGQINYIGGEHDSPLRVAPDFYTQDRNATAEAETKLAEMGLIYDYEHKLTILYFSNGGRQNPKMAVVLASPRQRCEAMYAIREHIEEVRSDL